MKNLKFILAFAMLFGAVATVGVAPAINEVTKVEAAATTVTLTGDDFSSGSYAANNGTKTYHGISINVTNIMKSGGIQFKKNNAGVMYNTSALSGPITSIELTYSKGTVSVYSSTSQLSSKPSASTGKVVNNVYTPTNKTDTYFRIQNTSSGVANLTSIKINYGSADVATYTTNFAMNDGTTNIFHIATTEENKSVTFPEDPVRSGYKFLGWYSQAEGGALVETLVATSNTTLYAHWEAVKYTVSFETENNIVYNGGSLETDENGEIVLPEVEIEGNYSFGGWYEDDTLVGMPGDVYVPTANVTLLGKRDNANVMIGFSDNGGTQDGGSVSSLSDISTYFTEGKEYVSAISFTNVYKGITGLKFGASEKAGSAKFTLSKMYNIEKIVINAKAYNTSDDSQVKIDSSSAVKLTPNYANYTFEINNETNTFVISQVNANKGRFNLKSIKVYYVESESNNHSVSFDTNGGEFADAEEWSNMTFEGERNVVLPVESDLASTPYKYTKLVGWNDGNKTYLPGATVTVSETTRFTAVYEAPELITIAQALEICAIAGSTKTTYAFSVEGEVVSISDMNEKYHSVTVVITDGVDSIEAYGMIVPEELDAPDFEVGYTIKVTGHLKTYINSNNSKPEFDSNCTYEIVSVPVTLTSIAATPSKTEYLVGDEFVKATVTATYSDGSTADVTAEATFTGYDMATAGTQTVTVTYEGLTDTYEITVVAPLPTPAEKLAEVETRASVGFAYTKTGEEYSFSNVRISWRATVSAELIAELGEITAAGFECSIEGNELVKTINCTESIGTDAEGNTYIFGSLLIPSEVAAKTLITTKAFFEVGGEKVYLQETTHSFETAVKAYLNGAVELTEEQEEALNALAAAYNIVA